jgi:hypothetical protein
MGDVTFTRTMGEKLHLILPNIMLSLGLGKSVGSHCPEFSSFRWIGEISSIWENGPSLHRQQSSSRLFSPEPIGSSSQEYVR